MIKLKDLLKESHGEIEFVSPEETDIDYYEDLNRIERESGINILRNRELTVLAIKNGKVVGALYEGIVGAYRFTFDIIVDKSERGKGIGSKLTDIGISDYHSVSENYVLELDIINPIMIPHLQNRGLKIVEKRGNHVTMRF